ncbi:ankyrin [Neocallimastix lanati (nom. inval.)]|jgi:ankyrin repeat protein|uniref:Ankyrin n=1 Tax=Neocallimastix californiae TaxID=1754190 RepID=A0A1Y2DG83_9FUNG|nr:ankyrin [Neocallimastix sp. JGI-2020a]ORY58292.1 ankyrin [Neocallimastix californiae]|eukprot:ORY58292.1 ankyrin [Neocallimastix californiae]
MTKTEFETFSETLLNQLKNENKDCLKTIEINNKLIEHYLNGQDLGYLKKFVNEFNETVIEARVNKYKLFEKVLNHKLFYNVIAEFRKSDVLIRACKKVNKKAVEWLLTMNIDPNVQDENGMTALMHAAEHVSTDFAVSKLLNEKSVNMVDNNGNNVLFHATNAPDILKKLLKSRVNVNYLNNDGENVLLYSCRNDKIRAYEILIKEKNADLNCVNCVGMTPAMYLVENARYREVESLVKKGKVNPNYVNKFGNSLVSVYIKKYYQQYIGNIGETNYASQYNYVVTKNYALTFRVLIDLGCDFNKPIDMDGNTPIVALLMMKDYVSAKYLIDNCSNLNLSIKNKYGVSGSSFRGFIDEKVFDAMNYNKTRNSSSISCKALVKAISEHITYENDTKYDPEIVDNGDVIIQKTMEMVNSYPIKPEIAKVAEQWVLEVLYPDAGATVSLVGNSYIKFDPNSFDSLLYKYVCRGMV